jgi:hypothetical protein
LKSRSIHDQTKKVLIATPLKNAAKLLGPFVAALARLSYPKSLLSLAFIASDSNDGTEEVAARETKQFLSDFANVSIFVHNFNYEAPKDRHKFEVQAARRAILAKSRNELLRRSLTQDIDAVLWLDVDVTGIPPTMVQDLLSVGQPVVAPNVVIDDVVQGWIVYDKNSWLQVKEAQNVQAAMTTTDTATDNVAFFESYDQHEPGLRYHMDALRSFAGQQGIRDWRYSVKLDGVGTAALLVDAKLHREAGLFFPENPYKHRLESEGFGLLARDHGFHACGLPLYDVHHVDNS